MASTQVYAKGVYQSGPDFIKEVFAPHQPQAKVLWVNLVIRQQAEKHRPQSRGIAGRYWFQYGDKTAWILNEIGKEMPITIGSG